MNKIIIAIVIIALLAGAGYVLSQNKTTQSATPSTTITDQANPTAVPSTAIVSSDSAAMQAGKTVEVTVDGSNFKFEPSQIKVKKGDTVKVTFKNTGGSHDFVIDAFNVKSKTISNGQSETVQFVADKAGTYEYYCSTGNHRQMGMKGTLTVE